MISTYAVDITLKRKVVLLLTLLAIFMGMLFLPSIR